MIGLQRVQGRAQPGRQHRRPAGVVAVPLQLGRRFRLIPDAQVDRRADGGHGQVRVGGGVAEADLHPRGRAAFRRHPHHGAAVIQAPVDQPGRQRVRAKPLVRVDRGVQQRAERGRVPQHAADRVPADRRQAVRSGGIAEHVAAALVVDRYVHVKPGAALVVERLGHEGGHQVTVPGDLLHGGLEPERAVRRVDELRVTEVDLELARRELVVRRRHPQAGVPELPEHVQQQPLRIALAADHVDVPQLVRVTPPAPGAVLLAHEEFQLGAADQLVAEAGHPIGHPPHHGTRRLRRGRAVGRAGVAEAPGGVRLPRQRREGREVRPHGDVGQPCVQAALHRDHIAHRGGVVDGAAERQPVLGHRGQLVQQHVAAPVDADHVRVGDPDHVDALGAQPLGDGGNV